jgi:peptide/nickel transport system permease protein
MNQRDRRPPWLSLVALGAFALLAWPAVLWIPESAAGTTVIPLAPPGWPHLLGTDRLARDVVQVTAAAAAYSLVWATAVLAASVIIGIALALVSVCWWKRWPDTVVVLSADAVRSFPSLILALLFFTAGLPVNFVLVLYFWIPTWRVARSQLAAQRERPYILGGRLCGHSRLRTLAVHGLPNALRGFTGVMLLVFVEVLSVQAGLEFLGFTVPLSRPTLGNVTSEALRLGGQFAWVWLPAALVASGLAVGLVLLARSRIETRSTGLE